MPINFIDQRRELEGKDSQFRIDTLIHLLGSPSCLTHRTNSLSTGRTVGYHPTVCPSLCSKGLFLMSYHSGRSRNISRDMIKDSFKVDRLPTVKSEQVKEECRKWIIQTTSSFTYSLVPFKITPCLYWLHERSISVERTIVFQTKPTRDPRRFLGLKPRHCKTI